MLRLKVLKVGKCLYKKIAKRGFNPINKSKIAKINLDQLQKFVDSKKIDPSNQINLEVLHKNKIINKTYSKYKILANGNLTSKIDIEADFPLYLLRKNEKLGGVIKVKDTK